jgi:SAM-dependent methyltransferase
MRFSPEMDGASQDYDFKHFQLLVSLEDRSFWFQARNGLITWALTRFFPKAARVMEVGVGTGFVMRALSGAVNGAAFWGSDIHIEGLRFAASRVGDKVDLIQMDARRIPFRDHFDVICAFDVLEHISEDEAVLRELRLALRQRGGLILSVPQHMFLWGPADENAFHQRRYGASELSRKVRDAGFDVIFKTSFVSLLLPALYLARIRSRKLGRHDLSKELVPHPALNWLMGRLLELEAAFIRAGFRMPFGGSQLLVAVRS